MTDITQMKLVILCMLIVLTTIAVADGFASQCDLAFKYVLESNCDCLVADSFDSFQVQPPLIEEDEFVRERREQNETGGPLLWKLPEEKQSSSPLRDIAIGRTQWGAPLLDLWLDHLSLDGRPLYIRAEESEWPMFGSDEARLWALSVARDERKVYSREPGQFELEPGRLLHRFAFKILANGACNLASVEFSFSRDGITKKNLISVGQCEKILQLRDSVWAGEDQKIFGVTWLDVNLYAPLCEQVSDLFLHGLERAPSSRGDRKPAKVLFLKQKPR